MKKLGCLLAVCAMVLVGCAKEEKVMVCSFEEVDDGTTSTENYEFKAKGDEVYLQTNESTLVFTDKEYYDAVLALVQSEEEEEVKYEGYTTETTHDDEKMVIKSKEVLDYNVLSKEDEMELSGDDTEYDFISLEETQKNFDTDGRTCTIQEPAK